MLLQWRIYIVVKRNIAVNNTAAVGATANNTNKKVIFKNCGPITDCISETNNTQIDNAKYIDIVMPMYNLIEYSNNFSKHVEACGNIVKIYQLWMLMTILLSLMVLMLLIHLILDQTDNTGRIDNAEIMVALKNLNNFWRTLEMSLINCEINLILTWSASCVILIY